MSRRKVEPDNNVDMFQGIILQMYLLHKYGPRLDMAELAAVLHVHPRTINNMVAQNTLPVRTYVDVGRFADFRDVALYLEKRRQGIEESA